MNEAFKALSDPTRRAILHELRKGPRSAGDLAERFPLAKSTLSGHFNVLKAADLVATEKQGTTVIYRLNASVFDEVLSYLIGLFGTERVTVRSAENPTTKEIGHENP
jgi:ArsR family transcriptional regulator